MNDTSKVVTMSRYDVETGETTLNVPLMDATQRLRAALGFASAAARRRFPASHGRIDAASRLIVEGKVVLHPDNTATVASETDDARVYEVNGACPCPDFARAPEQWCKHRLAAAIARKACRLVEAWATVSEAVIVAPQDGDDDMPVEGPVQTTVTLPECPDLRPSMPVVQSEVTHVTQDTREPVTVPEAFIARIQGKPFVLFAGLLDLAHRQGLLALSEEVTHVTDTYVLASARAEFPDGRVFRGVGDSSPDNVGKQVKPHWRRLAGTRAMARCLRSALNIHLVAVEELD